MATRHPRCRVHVTVALTVAFIAPAGTMIREQSGEWRAHASAEAAAPSLPRLEFQETPVELTLDALLAATPDELQDDPSDDRDGDGIPNTVELVLGINPDLADSDGDFIDDRSELDEGLNPAALDTNDDGLPDNLEVEGPVDMDGDGEANVWDDDNDGDGVRDGLDLSPYGASPTAGVFTLDVVSTDEPTYVDVQLRPGNEAHMNLTGSRWDWPEDTVGLIQDRVETADDVDVRIMPMLQLNAASGPDPAQLEKYGIIDLPPNPHVGWDDELLPNPHADLPAPTEGDWKVLVPLSPVVDDGRIVALSGRMLYPDGVPPTETTAKLVWVTTGPADTAESSSMFTTYVKKGEGWNNPAPVGGTLRDQEKDATCTVAEIVVTEIDYPDFAIDFRCEEPLSGGATFSEGDHFFYEPWSTELGTVDESPIGEHSILIARYAEDYLLTGLVATENHGSEVGVVYGPAVADDEAYVSTGLALSFDYLRGEHSFDEAVQFMVGDVAEGALGLDVSSRAGWASHSDDGFSLLTGSLLPAAVADVGPGHEIFVFSVIEDDSTTSGPSDWSGTDLLLDVSAPDAVVTRTMKLTFVDTTTGWTLPDTRGVELVGWSLDEEDLELVAGLGLAWTAGDRRVITVGDQSVPNPAPDWPTILGYVESGLILTGEALAVARGADSAFGTIAHLNDLRLRGIDASGFARFKVAFRNAKIVALGEGITTPLRLTSWTKALKAFSRIGHVAFALGIGIGFYEAIALGFEYDWSTEGTLRALWHLAQYFFFEVELIILGPVFAAIAGILLALDAIFDWGWWEAFQEWWAGIIAQDKPLVAFTLDQVGDADLGLARVGGDHPPVVGVSRV